MSYARTFLGEFDHEMQTTRTLLERVPEARGDWKPHPKSHSLGSLANHLAFLPSFAEMVMTSTERDARSPMTGRPSSFESTAKLLELFDGCVARGRAAVEAASDEDFRVPWTFSIGGKTIFTLPRGAALRSFVMNHFIHHRGQLTVYLRLNDVPLPSIYGPTADEPM